MRRLRSTESGGCRPPLSPASCSMPSLDTNGLCRELRSAVLFSAASSPLSVSVPRGRGHGSIPGGPGIILLSSGSPCVVGGPVLTSQTSPALSFLSVPSSMVGTAAIAPFHLTRLWLPLQTLKHHQGCAPIWGTSLGAGERGSSGTSLAPTGAAALHPGGRVEFQVQGVRVGEETLGPSFSWVGVSPRGHFEYHMGH